jgi:outer membrane lipoprotein-sorting protein
MEATMQRSWFPTALCLAVFCAAAGAQAPPGALLNRLNSNYRSMQSFRCEATLSRKVEGKDKTATLTLAAQWPNKFLAELTGENVNTLIVSDGTSLIALRPDRKVYTKTKAPARLNGADVLGKVDIPSPGARIISLLLEGRLRDADDPLARALNAAEIGAAQTIGGKDAVVLSFPYYSDVYDARVYVTTDDSLIRRIVLLKNGVPEVVEQFAKIDKDPQLPADTFTRALPEGARLVASLPPLETPAAASSANDFTLRTIDGNTISLSKLKGKVVLLNFFFVT